MKSVIKYLVKRFIGRSTWEWKNREEIRAKKADEPPFYYSRRRFVGLHAFRFVLWTIYALYTPESEEFP